MTRVRNVLPGVPGYDLDRGAVYAPVAWYGVNDINAAAPPWSDAPLGSHYYRLGVGEFVKVANAKTAADWRMLIPAAAWQRVVRVDAAGNGDYTKLSDALAAITDASDSKEYLIVISGEVQETAQINLKNFVHILFLPGASVTVTAASGHGLNLSSLTNVVVAAVDPLTPHIILAGSTTTSQAAVRTAACGAGVELVNLYARNTSSQSNSHGFLNTSSSSPTMTNCTGVSGSGSSSSGILNSSSSSPSMTNCIGIGGGGTSTHGIYNLTSSPTMINCTGIGGSTGGGCYGILNTSSASPTMINCTGIGGSGGASGYGIHNASSSSPLLANCTGIGGGVMRAGASATIAASSRQEDSFRPGTGFPYRLVAVSINVTAAAAAGVTLTLRDATGGGGNALTASVAVDSTGTKNVPITGHRVIAGDGYVYARLSAVDSTLAYTITYIYERCFTTCYALYNDTDAQVQYINCTFISNAASDAVYCTNNGILRSLFLGGVARSGSNDGTRMKAMNCQSAWSPGQVYNMVLDGGTTNLTAAAGTANGSNIEV